MTDILESLVGGSTDPIIVIDNGSSRLVSFNRPEARNAMTLAMRKTFVEIVQAADVDPAISVIIVTGAGGAFSAGADLKERAANPGMPMHRPHPGETLRALSKTVIAAVDGPCATGALELALSCSFILASPRARFADTHAKVGLIAGWGMSAMLPRAIGVRRARQMMSSGEFIDAATAYQWGLVNEIVERDVVARAMAVAQAIAASPQLAVGMQLGVMSRGEGETVHRALELEESMRAEWRVRRDAAQAS
jgi:enoyl-CoA hydratase